MYGKKPHRSYGGKGPASTADTIMWDCPEEIEVMTMQYISTRDSSLRYSAAQAIVQGLSRDGGLFLPETIPALTAEDLQSMVGMTYQQRAVKVMKA